MSAYTDWGWRRVEGAKNANQSGLKLQGYFAKIITIRKVRKNNAKTPVCSEWILKHCRFQLQTGMEDGVNF